MQYIVKVANKSYSVLLVCVLSLATSILNLLSYEEYISHVLEKHEDQPSVRMQPKIRKKEISET
jgi:hypothetical protein